jgi:hypothetical protein
MLMRASSCAVSFYEQKFRGDVLVTTSLLSVQNQVMRFRDPDPHFPDNDSADEFRCHGGTVTATRIVGSEELSAKQSVLVTDILTELTWAFWQGTDKGDLR